MNSKIPLALSFVFLFFLGCVGLEEECPPDTDCRDYSSQYSAQLAFDLDPACKGDLDADNDGIACEEWDTYYQSLNDPSSNPGGNGGCPSTAACGCSNKNKSACETSSCCRWTVGQGCGCR